jgi:hypothetical protein
MELVNRSPCSRIFLPFTCLDMFNNEKNALQVSVFRKIETTVNNNLTCKKIITAHRTLLLEMGLPNATSTVQHGATKQKQLLPIENSGLQNYPSFLFEIYNYIH